MSNTSENPQMSTKSTLIEDKNKQLVDKDKNDAKKPFTDKIVNKISNIDGVKEIENAIDKSSNVKFITFGLFALIGFIVIIYAILVAVVADTVIQAANVFFVVTIISISTLVGTLVYQIRPAK
jgi:uncharacterized membrane-anchored protein